MHDVTTGHTRLHVNVSVVLQSVVVKSEGVDL